MLHSLQQEALTHCSHGNPSRSAEQDVEDNDSCARLGLPARELGQAALGPCQLPAWGRGNFGGQALGCTPELAADKTSGPSEGVKCCWPRIDVPVVAAEVLRPVRPRPLAAWPHKGVSRAQTVGEEDPA